MEKINLNNVTIGADPEFFIRNKEGKVVSIEGKLGGTKNEPIDVPEAGLWTAYLEDNVMAEFNIDPCTSADEFVHQNQTMIGIIMSKLDGYTPDFNPAHMMSYLEVQTEQGREFGCMPDHNAYTLEFQKVCAEEAGELRTAGGHIHIGIKEMELSLEDSATIARAFDLFVTMPFMQIEPDNKRRQLYGKAGSFRNKHYGLECRQLSCYWLSSPELMHWVYDQTIKAIQFVNSNKEIHQIDSNLCLNIRDIIDNKLMDKITPMIEEYSVLGENVKA